MMSNLRFHVCIITGLLICLSLTFCKDGKPANQPAQDCSLTTGFVDTIIENKPDCQTVYTNMRVYNICNADSTPSADDTIRKYRLNMPYHQKCDTVGDSLVIQFDVNLQCGAKLAGDACSIGDSVLFVGCFESREDETYGITSCDCNFRLVYKVLNGPYKKLFTVIDHASTMKARGINLYAAPKRP